MNSILLKKRKSQAALEFLTTYAWAFIMIMILIAAISYFGVVKPKEILPDRCIFNAGFGCQAYRIDSAGNIDMILKNQIGDTITVSTITLMEEDETGIAGCTPPGMPTGWRAGTIKSLAWTGCSMPSDFVAGAKAKMIVDMDFYVTSAGVTFMQNARGEILAAVQ